MTLVLLKAVVRNSESPPALIERKFSRKFLCEAGIAYYKTRVSKIPKSLHCKGWNEMKITFFLLVVSPQDGNRCQNSGLKTLSIFPSKSFVLEGKELFVLKRLSLFQQYIFCPVFFWRMLFVNIEMLFTVNKPCRRNSVYEEGLCGNCDTESEELCDAIRLLFFSCLT